MSEGRRWRREDQRRYQEQKRETYVATFSHLRELDKVIREVKENEARSQQAKKNSDSMQADQAEIRLRLGDTAQNVAALQAATDSEPDLLLAREQRLHALQAELTASQNSLNAFPQLMEANSALLDRIRDEDRLITATLKKLHRGSLEIEAVMNFLAPEVVLQAMTAAIKASGRDSFSAANAAFLHACRKDLGTA